MIVSALQDPSRLGGHNFHDSHRVKRRKLDVPVANNDSHVRPRAASFGEHATESAFDDLDSNAVQVPPHPLGIKPLGNSWDAQVNIKAMSGSFARLPDETLAQLLDFLDSLDLVALGSTCKALYAFCRSDELWKSLFIESSKTTSDFAWRGTWRSTFLNLPPHVVSTISCSGLFSDHLYRPYQCANLPLGPYASNIPPRNAIARLPDLTAEEYTQSWADKPFILTDPVKSWPAYKEWSIENLLHKHSDTVFRAEAVDWKFKTYVDYMHNNTDESPLYLFDCHFANKMHLPGSRTTNPDPAHPPAYTPPAAFAPDLFETLSPHRPDHRWLIIGPARSGSTFHADPNGTAAWNAVLRGAKYWLLFPPPDPSSDSSSGTSIPGVHLSPDLSHIAAPLSLSEYLLSFHAAARASPRAVEAVCAPGELLHVPAGWYHMVVNLAPGVAITQNFVSAAGAAGALAFLRDRREQVSGFVWGRGGADGEATEEQEAFGEGSEYELFVAGLKAARPDVAAQALEELAMRDRRKAAVAAKGQRRRVGTRWEEVTKGSGEKGKDGQSFSFGFGDGDDEDADDTSNDERC